MSESLCIMCGVAPAYTVFGSGLCEACKLKEKIREEREENEERRHRERMEAEEKRLREERERHEELLELEQQRLEALEVENEPVYSSPSHSDLPSPSVYSAPIINTTIKESETKIDMNINNKGSDNIPSEGRVIFAIGTFICCSILLVGGLVCLLVMAVTDLNTKIHKEVASIESENDANPVNDGDIVAYEEGKFSKY